MSEVFLPSWVILYKTLIYTHSLYICVCEIVFSLEFDVIQTYISCRVDQARTVATDSGQPWVAESKAVASRKHIQFQRLERYIKNNEWWVQCWIDEANGMVMNWRRLGQCVSFFCYFFFRPKCIIFARSPWTSCQCMERCSIFLSFLLYISFFIFFHFDRKWPREKFL